jgi:hypothetical protein
MRAMDESTKKKTFHYGEVEELVNKGIWTIEQAEDWARENGYEFSRKHDVTHFDPLTQIYWSMPMALAWIAWRDPDKVRRVWPDYRSWCREWEPIIVNGKRVGAKLVPPSAGTAMADLFWSHDGLIPLLETPVALRPKLESGIISSTGINQKNEREIILPLQWCDLHFGYYHDEDDDCLIYRAHGKHTRSFEWIAYIRVRIPVSEMLAEFPALSSFSPPVQKLSSSEAEALLKKEIGKRGGFINQADAAEFIRDRDPSFKRDSVREIVKQLTGNSKPGPRTKTKN